MINRNPKLAQEIANNGAAIAQKYFLSSLNSIIIIKVN